MHQGGPEWPQRSAGTGDDASGGDRRSDDLQADAVEQALLGSGAYGAMVYLRSRDRRSLMLSTVAGIPVAALEPFRRVSVQSALPGSLAYRSGRTVYLSGTEDTMRRFPQLLIGLPYAFASAYVPVIGSAETYGVLCVLWPATPDDAPSGARRHLRRTARRLGAELDRLVAEGGVVEGRRTVAELLWPPTPTIRLGLFDLDLQTRTIDLDDEVRAILGLAPVQVATPVTTTEDPPMVAPGDEPERPPTSAPAQEPTPEGAPTPAIGPTPATTAAAALRLTAAEAAPGPAPETAVGPTSAPAPAPGPVPAPADRATDVQTDVEPTTAPAPPAAAGPENLARAIASAIDPEDLPKLGTALRRAARTGVFPPLRLQVRGDDATRARFVQVWGQVRDAGGDGLAGRHLTGAVLDMGTTAAAAQAVERMRRGVFSLDPDGRVDYVNLGGELLLAIRREELLGRRLWEALPWLADPAYEDRHRAAVITRQPTAFLARRPPDRWLAFSLYPDAHGMTGTVVEGASEDGFQGQLGREVSAAVSAGALVAHPDGRPGPGAGAGAIYHLLRLASAMAEAVSVREVCAVVAEQILPAFGGQELAIYMVDQSRLRLALQVGYPEGFLDPFEGTSLRARVPGAEALASRSPIFFASVDELSSAYPGLPLDQMCAWAFLPLIASGRPVGSCILGFDEPHLFTSEERSVLSALGGLIAQALERARLYDAEFALARGLQQALLPHALPRLKGLDVAARYLPGTRGMEIGGDWYDAIVTPRGLCLVVGDVEGHSVAAAGVMGQLRSAVRAFVASGHPPGEVLEHLNRLLPDLDSQLLASCCLIELDPSSGRASGVRAGHLPPVLRHPDGRTDILELGGGMLLGVDPDAVYPVEELTLAPGSVLALYTDGLVERPGVPIDSGIDRLRAVLATGDDDASLDDLAEHLLTDTLSPAGRLDDVVVLLARLDS